MKPDSAAAKGTEVVLAARPQVGANARETRFPDLPSYCHHGHLKGQAGH